MPPTISKPTSSAQLHRRVDACSSALLPEGPGVSWALTQWESTLGRDNGLVGVATSTHGTASQSIGMGLRKSTQEGATHDAVLGASCMVVVQGLRSRSRYVGFARSVAAGVVGRVVYVADGSDEVKVLPHLPCQAPLRNVSGGGRAVVGVTGVWGATALQRGLLASFLQGHLGGVDVAVSISCLVLLLESPPKDVPGTPAQLRYANCTARLETLRAWTSNLAKSIPIYILGEDGICGWVSHDRNEPFLTAEPFHDDRVATLRKLTFGETEVLCLFDSFREQRGAKGAGYTVLPRATTVLSGLVHASRCLGAPTVLERLPHVVLVAEGGQHGGGIRDLGDEPSPTSASNTPQTEPDAGGVGVASVVEVPPLSEGLFTLVKGDGTSHLVELCC